MLNLRANGPRRPFTIIIMMMIMIIIYTRVYMQARDETRAQLDVAVGEAARARKAEKAAMAERDNAKKERDEAARDLKLERARASKLYEGCSKKDEAIAAQV